MKFLFAKIFILVLLCSYVASFDVKCSYPTQQWAYTGSIRYCDVKNTLIESKTGARTVSSINDESKENRSDILGFWAENQLVRYFPHKLTKFFPNLNSVGFKKSELMEIHAEDLQEFGDKLQYFRIASCKIEIVEKDLFKYNPNLGIIGLDNNRIKYIEGAVFDHLNNLDYLWLNGNFCVNENVSTRSETENLIETTKDACYRNYMILRTYELVNKIASQYTSV